MSDRLSEEIDLLVGASPTGAQACNDELMLVTSRRRISQSRKLLDQRVYWPHSEIGRSDWSETVG